MLGVYEPYPQLHHSIKMAQRVGVLCTGTIERGGVLLSTPVITPTLGAILSIVTSKNVIADKVH